MENTDNFRALAENANDGILVATGEGEHVYANRRASEITGFSIQEILEIRMQDLAHPDALKKLEKRLREKLEGKPVPPRYETAILRKDGKKVRVEVTGAKTYWEGQPADIVIFRDITFRKYKEEELKARVEKRTAELTQMTEQLNALMNATTDTVLLIDLKGYVVAANTVTAERFGMRLDKFIGTCSYDLMSPSLARSRKAIANRVVKTRKPHRFEDERRGIIFDSTVYPVLDEGGRVVQLAIYGKDITELKRSERALKRTEEDLRIKTKSLEEMNTALKILLNSKDQDQREFEERILSNVKHLVLPYLGKMRKHLTDEKLKAYLDVLEANLSNIISPFSQKLSSKYIYLTTTEIEVANLVKEGRSTKDIAEMLGVSYKTIQNHRVNIRKKLRITKKPINLRTYLLSLQ